MPSPSTLVLANHLIADAERHWLYGHPYREVPGPSPYAARAARPRRVRGAAAARVRRGVRPLFGRHGLAA
jgi:hypothetical protein